MYNLYKQWNVVPEQEGTRVIDSDAIMEAVLRKNAEREAQRAREKAGEADADGFRAGIFADAEVIEPEAEPEPEVDYVALAKEEAERILEEAREKAADEVSRAQAEAGDIREDARQKGYRDGKDEADREFLALKEDYEGQYRERENALEADYVAKRDSMEEDLVDVILNVFNKVFHIQFDNKKHILMYLIDHAIENIEGEKKFKVRVATGNVTFLENHRDEIIERVGHDIEIEFLGDATMDGNACTIETDSGVFDCSLGTQLENLIKDIRSLCSQG